MERRGPEYRPRCVRGKKKGGGVTALGGKRGKRKKSSFQRPETPWKERGREPERSVPIIKNPPSKKKEEKKKDLRKEGRGVRSTS